MEQLAVEKVQDAKSAHEIWIEQQGIPIYREFNIPNLKEVVVGPWGRLNARGAYIMLDGAEDSNDACVLEIPPGGSTAPEHHMYEEIIYVLSGRGATTVYLNDGPKRSFEWHEGSLFAIPLNAWHQFFNGQGQEPARFYVVSSAPLLMNLFHHTEFIYGCDYAFTDRFNSQADFFNGQGVSLPGRVWETNLVEDIRDLQLMEWKERGAGGVNRRLELAGGSMAAHVSQFPVGTYKKGHKHGPGAHVIILKGEGYSLLWREGKEAERVRVDWQEGSVLVPPNMWMHQHFNVGDTPGKYLAIRWGSIKNPVLKAWSVVGKTDVSVNEGGYQIEYEDEDPAIRQLFEKELGKRGVACRMPAPR